MSEDRKLEGSTGSVDRQKPDCVGFQGQRQMSKTMHPSDECLRSHLSKKIYNSRFKAEL